MGYIESSILMSVHCLILSVSKMNCLTRLYTNRALILLTL